MKIETNKIRIVISASISSFLILFIALIGNDFFKEDTTSGTLLFVLCIICSLLIGVINAIQITLPQKFEKIFNTILFIILPVVSITMVECLNYVFIYNFYFVDFFNNYFLYLLFLGLVFAICGSYKLAVLIVNPILFVFALANYYIYTFRGSPFVPMDFLNIETAQGVASTYNFSPTYQIVISVVLLVGIIIIGCKLKTPKFHKATKIVARLSCAVIFITVSMIFFFTDIFSKCGLEPDFWNQTRGYHKSGFVLNFCLNTKYLYLHEPSGYNAEDVEEFVAELTNETTKEDISTETPNIICIMNESFSDLSVCGEFETNKDPLKFYNSLTENTIKGNLFVPVHGAGTSNTEYEFLTGNSTSFFPSGSNAFMLYVKDNAPSLVSTLKNSGYSRTAFHPYYSSGWNRRQVYTNFKFQKFYSITSIIEPFILNEYIRSGYNVKKYQALCRSYYPEEDILIRQYVSDSYNYKKLISYYEERDPSVPYFMFNVTMQNHGGYTTSQDILKSQVKLTTTKGVYPKTEQYLTLLRESDKALEELINYFKKCKEPTIICMFGDHQPNIEEEFYEEIMGTENLDDLSIEYRQKRYTTPFLIWANYDIEEEYIDKLSVNYLSTYLLKVANARTTAYNEYLYNLSKEIPVINNLGYVGSNGVYYENGEKSEYSDLLKKYSIIQYNNAIDTANKINHIFY